MFDWLESCIEQHIHIYKKLNFTPNSLTIIGILSSALCLYFLYVKNLYLSIIFFVIKVYFDYADGIMARKYNMQSKIGEKLDHYSDIAVGILIPLVIIASNKSKNVYIIITLLLIGIILLSIQNGCEMKYKNTTKDKKSISKLTKLCKSPKFRNPIYAYFGYLIIIFAFIIHCIK